MNVCSSFRDFLTSGWRSDGTWLWGDDTHLVFDNWHSGHPPELPTSDELYVALTSGSSMEMVVHSSIYLYFICELTPGNLCS